MFETLNERLEKIVSSIRGKAVISESDLDTTMREIRIGNFGFYGMYSFAQLSKHKTLSKYFTPLFIRLILFTTNS